MIYTSCYVRATRGQHRRRFDACLRPISPVIFNGYGVTSVSRPSLLITANSVAMFLKPSSRLNLGRLRPGNNDNDGAI